jgi:flavorubredoxin
MEARVDEIADGVYRVSVFVPTIGPSGFSFNHFLIRADEPLLFHTGLRRMFPAVLAAVETVLPARKLRRICFGHYEADECGSMNEWLAAAPEAEVMHGRVGALVSLNDTADRAPRVLADGEVVDLGQGRKVRWLDTPHIPHGWDAGVLFEEGSGVLLCGDLFTQVGDGPALTTADIVGPAIATEDLFRYSSLHPSMGKTIRKLADLNPRTLALMHGPSYAGEGGAALMALAEDYDRRLREIAG